MGNPEKLKARRLGIVLGLYLFAGTAGILPADGGPEESVILFGGEGTGKGMSVEELAAAAAAGNYSLKQAGRSVDEAERNLEGVFELDRSSITGSGTYGYAADITNPHSFVLSAAAAVPIIPQVLFGGSVTVPLYGTAAEVGGGEGGINGSVSVGLKPFSGFTDTGKADAAYEKARTAEAYLRRELVFEMEELVFNYLRSEKDLDLEKRRLELREDEYSTAKEEYGLGEISIPEVNDVYDELLAARREYYAAEKALLSTKKELAVFLGVPGGKNAGAAAYIVADISEEELESLSITRAEQMKRLTGGTPVSRELENLRIDLEALVSERAAVRTYSPDFSIDANFAMPGNTFRLGASFSFSPEDIQSDEVKTIEEKIMTAREQVETEMYGLTLTKKLLQAELNSAREMLELNRSAREDALLACEEAFFLAGEGELTELELRQTKLDAETAELRVFSALYDLLHVQREYVLLHSE